MDFEFFFFDLGDFFEDDFALKFCLFTVMVDLKFIEHVFDAFIMLSVGIKFIALDDEGHGVFDFLPHTFVFLDLLLFESFLERVHFFQPVGKSGFGLLDGFHAILRGKLVCFLYRRELHEFEGRLAEGMDGFGLLLILMELAVIEGSFRKTAGSLDRGELFLMGFVGLFL